MFRPARGSAHAGGGDCHDDVIRWDCTDRNYKRKTYALPRRENLLLEWRQHLSMRRPVYRLVPIVTACLLAACASSPSPEEEAAQRAALVANDEAKCRSYGFHSGTPEFDQCMTRLADQRAQSENALRAARLGGHPPPWVNF